MEVRPVYRPVIGSLPKNLSEKLFSIFDRPRSQEGYGILTEFVASETGKLLYDETSKLWWNGPSYIADLYLKEKSRCN